MIAADKKRWFEALFTLYNERYLLRRFFHQIELRGSIDPAVGDRPVLYMMNHSSWWDGLVVYAAVRRQSARQHYAMMDEQQLVRYRFFRRIGAFSVDKTRKRGVQESLQYAAGLLQNKQCVWLFPQGDIRHLEERPLRFQSGAVYLLEQCPQAVVQPVTAYYSLGAAQKPRVSLWFGEPIAENWATKGRKAAVEQLKACLESQLDRHRDISIAAIDGCADGFKLLLHGGRSTSEAFDRFKRRAARWKAYFGR